MAHLTRDEVLKSGEVAPEYRKVWIMLLLYDYYY